MPRPSAARKLRTRSRLRRPNLETLETRRLLVAEIEPNNTFATATVFTGSDSLTGNVRTQSDIDHFKIAATAGDSLQFRLNGNDLNVPSFDTTLEIINSSGDILAAAYDSHTISFQVAVAGDYALRLTSNNVIGPFVGSYNVQATVNAFAGVTEAESNNTIATANALNGQTNVRGNLAGSTDVDLFSIALQAGQGIGVKFTDQPNKSPAVRLLNSSGAVVSSGLDGTGLSTAVSLAGTYYVSIAADNTLGAVTGAYTAQILVANSPTFENLLGNDFTGAANIPLGPYVIPAQFLSPTSGFTNQGLTGSYINQSLRGTAAQTDWRTTQTVAGTRVDPTIHFPQGSWGTRSTVGITGGNDNDWDNYSVQWDGFVRIVNAGTQLYLASDDGSRLWIDINGDGTFNSSGTELINNNWGAGQGNTLSQASIGLAAGDYRIRIQYEEGGGGNLAYLLWSDSVNSGGGAVSANLAPAAMGSLSSLTDVDVFSVDLSGTGLYEFRLETTTGDMGWQSRLLTLYNEYGQPLDYSTSGFLNTNGWNTRVERSARYYLTVQATTASGLGAYKLVPRVAGQFPTYRDVPLYYQDYTGYSKQNQVPAFVAFFESRYDMYQIDVTLTQPPSGTENVSWKFTDTAGQGCGGAQGGGYGNRRPSGGGSGNCDANWTRLSDVWFGLFYHENGHGVGLFHARHPLNTMSYGGQYDFLPIGSFNYMGFINVNGDARVSAPRLFNMRDYLDWALEAGRIVLENENNDTRANAQYVTPYITEMVADTDARNDQAILVGSIGAIGDVDHYRLTVGAGDYYSFDIDSAEFQTALDATLDLLDSAGNILATSTGGIDRNTGLTSADPNLSYRFASAGDYTLRVRGETLTTGYYRLKVSPERALDTSGPRIAGAWPDGGQTIDSTRQLTWWLNDQLDPATLTSNNIIVRGATSGVQSGTATFDPFTSVLTWVADADLPIDNYTVTLRSAITDLQGNALDGETDGVLSFPEVSGNGTRGGDFTSTFIINAADTQAAVVTGINYYRQNHERDLLDIFVSDELDVTQANQTSYTLRGAGADGTLGTADDTFAPVDVMYDPMMNLGGRLLRVYTRALLEPDSYRIEANLRDATGQAVTLSQTFNVAAAVPTSALSTDSAGITRGLVGSYVNSSLRSYATQDDWRSSQRIAGTRTDDVVDFNTDSFGTRADVGVTGGSDANWDDFSVQWDGFITIPTSGTRLFTRSDDGSRMWIDINNDGVFATSGNEYVNNNWGNGQGVTTGQASVPLAAGRYRIRIQYEEGGGGNRMSLLWDAADARSTNDGMYNNLKVVDTSIQPNTVIDRSPASIDVIFNQVVATSTLTTNNFRVIYSPDADFFDGNDSVVSEANGQIGWSVTTRRASFEPAAPLAAGYYMIELNGDSGGITNAGGRLLDGEYRDGYIVGGLAQQAWSDAPSGDGQPGGDYRAIFIVAQPTVSMAISGVATLAEAGGTATIEARLSYASLYPITVDIETSGLAKLGADYQIDRTQIVIPAGSLSGSARITAIQDTIDEFDESIVVTLKSVVNATADEPRSVTVTIVDDDLEPDVRLSLDRNNFSEAGGQLVVTATLSARTEKDVEVSLQLGGQATTDVDYTQNSTSITIPAGSLTASLQIFAIQDALDELDETLTVDILSASNARNPGGQSQAALLIDDDAPPTFTLSVASATIAEAAGSTTVVATLSAVSGRNISIPLSYSGTAGSSDYSGASGLLVIGAGSTTAQVRLTATQDSLDEPDETIIVQAGTAINATSDSPQSVTTTIIDDDAPPVLTLSSTGSPMSEAGGQATVTATLSVITSYPVVVDFTIGGGTAESGSDYTTSSNQILIPAGQLSGSLTVTAIDDAIYERPETLVAAISNLTNATQLVPQQVAMIISNDDAAPKVSFTVDNASPTESGGAIQLTATLDKVSAVAVTIELSSQGTATLGADYQFTNRTLLIPAGSLSSSTSLTVVQDELHEATETILWSIADSVDVDVTEAILPMVSIQDDDVAPVLSLAFEAATISEAGGSTFLVARLDKVSALDVSAQLSWSGSATRTSDYQDVASSLVIAAGQQETKIPIRALNDSLYEASESIQISASSIIDASLSSSNPLTMEIVDDDPVPTVTMSIDTLRVTESNQLILITFQLSAAAGVPVTIDLQLEGDATLGADYLLATQATLPPMATRTDLRLDILSDALDELDETISIKIGQITNATSTSGPVSLIIVDDESFSLEVDTQSINELGGRASATLRRTGSDLSSDLVVSLNNSSSSALTAPATVTIPANQTSVQFDIAAVDDFFLTGNRQVTLGATAVGYLPDEKQVEVVDDELKFPFRNPRNSLDVNNNGSVTPLDALLIINHLNTVGPGPLAPPPQLPFEPEVYLDTSEDNFVTAIDALLVINYLNTHPNGEGEVSDWDELTSLAAPDPRKEKSAW